MNNKPYVLVKCAMSLDGFIDDSSDEKLILSNEKDFKKVDEERSKCDAILVGAETVRKDNPRLLLKFEELCKERLSNGKSRFPMKVTITTTGNFSKDSKFFNIGDAKKIVYCTENVLEELKNKLNNLANIIPIKGSEIDLGFVLEDLKQKGVNKLMVEGGSKILTMFLSKNLVDEIQISIAPFFVGDENGVRFVNPGDFPFDKNNRMKLVNAEIIGDIVLLTYKLK